MNTLEPASDWPFVSESWIGIMGGSGSNPNQIEGPPSVSRSLFEETRAGSPSHVLVVEDNESDVFLIQEAIEAARIPVVLQIVKDGEQAIRFFDRVQANVDIDCPSLVILDINLPKKQGGEVLKYMRQSPRCANALVIAVSTSDSARDRQQMKNLGANRYFRKPSEYDDFMKLGQVVKGLLAGEPSDVE